MSDLLRGHSAVRWAVSSSCVHGFCLDCIAHWIGVRREDEARCPVCKDELKKFTEWHEGRKGPENSIIEVVLSYVASTASEE